MQELGIQQIFARSPEAKGRVERTNGTFQDRLVTELRLAGVATMGEANKVLWDFLPRFNQQFGAPPQQFVSAYRSVEPDMPLDEILSFKYRRKVARDNTIKYNWQIQLANTTGKYNWQIQLANPPAAPQHGTAQLCWSPGGGPGAAGWPSSRTLSRPHHPYPGGATTPWSSPDPEWRSRRWSRRP